MTSSTSGRASGQANSTSPPATFETSSRRPSSSPRASGQARSNTSNLKPKLSAGRGAPKHSQVQSQL
eukprot:2382519-Alexandrium_andersonii.AAC.1